jgi:DNA-binding LacI/PurR family transcriptional regulator
VEFLARGEPFTALMVANDSMAIGALYALYEHGIHVPDEVSLISFDNAAHAQFTIPPLTTVNFSFDVQNKLAFQFLFELIEDPDTEPHQHVLLPELVVRQSTRQIG